MGMYTEMVLGVRLRRDPARDAPLAWALGYPDAEQPGGEGFWTFDRSNGFLGGGGLVTWGIAPVLRPAWEHLKPDHPEYLDELVVWTSIKNYDLVLDRFLDWLGPFVRFREHPSLERRTHVGWMRYEEADHPYLLYWDPETRTIDQVLASV
jgi:hypothetical protein